LDHHYYRWHFSRPEILSCEPNCGDLLQYGGELFTKW